VRLKHGFEGEKKAQSKVTLWIFLMTRQNWNVHLMEKKKQSKFINFNQIVCITLMVSITFHNGHC